MKIALCQTNIIWENKKSNILNAENIIKNTDADIIFFPEMSFTGFSSEIEKTGENGETVKIIKNIAEKYKKAIGFGWTKICGDMAFNMYTVVSDKGDVLSDYAKIHPFSYSGEDKKFLSGNKVVYFNYKGFNIGTLICYDLRFPEIFQALSKNADIIVVPACWPEKRIEHWKTLLKARAIENQCYIAGVNCVGDIGGLKYSGDSMLIDPNGEILYTDSYKESVIVGEINNDVSEYRNSFPTKRDRKILFYKEIL